VAATLHHVPQKPAPQPSLTLTPIFFNTQGYLPYTVALENGPQFAYVFTNTTHKDLHLTEAVAGETIILDGKEYKKNGLSVWLDNDTLRPGDTYTNSLQLRQYLPGTDASTPKTSEADFKWSRASLADGSHTLIYKMGGKTYGPITFIWHSQAIP